MPAPVSAGPAIVAVGIRVLISPDSRTLASGSLPTTLLSLPGTIERAGRPSTGTRGVSHGGDTSGPTGSRCQGQHAARTGESAAVARFAPH